MKVLITGGPGRIGRSLLAHCPPDIDIELLLEPVVQQVPGYAWYRSDITDFEKTNMAVTCADPDVVIHLAAATDVDACERDPDMAMRVNADGAGNIAKACTACGASMMLMSTDYVFDGVSGPYSEDDSPNPINVYGRSKLEGEQAAKASVENLLIVRISVPFGLQQEGTNHNFVSWLFEELQAGKTVNIVRDQYTTPAYMEELSRVLWKLIEEKTTGIIHYGTGDRLSRFEMAREICDVMDFSSDLVKPLNTADLNFFARRPLESGFVTEKIHSLLNTPPILFRAAVMKIMEAMETGK